MTARSAALGLLAISILVSAPLPAAAGGPAPRRLAVAWTRADGSGALRAMSTAAPWGFVTPELGAGGQATLRFANGLLFVVSRSAGTIVVVDPVSWTPIRNHALGANSEPIDIAVVSERIAYVTRAGATRLLRLDLESGATQEVVNLAFLADADGVPDLGTLAVDGNHLFVQIRRFDLDVPGFVPPALLAVVDLALEQPLDVDPAAPGVQAIALQGTAAKFGMQIVPGTRRLFVSATGGDFDQGGIEQVDLDTLRSLGLVVAEADGETGSDLGAFVLVNAERGFLTFTTDLTLSSHLVPFTLSGGAGQGQLHVVVDYFVPALAHEPRTGTLYMPEGGFSSSGVGVLDATSGALLTQSPTATDGSPTDLALLCDCTDADCPGMPSCAAVPTLAPPGFPAGLVLTGTAALAAAVLALRTRARATRRRAATDPRDPGMMRGGTGTAR